ncbi:hypothetical protein SDC9_129352 [bioreactor metagenome]|uniref:Uncharacterized protein n=1 Tax=bioreactor metagenome TaxID=1076179 RepID=A0A645CZI3_9ZZZZ
MLHDGFARAEGAGDGGGAALGDGEQGVHNPLARQQRGLGRIFMLIRAAHTHGPLLHHGELHRLPVVLLEDGHRISHGKGAAGDAFDGAGQVGRYHDLVQHHLGFLHGSDDVAANHLGAGSHSGRKLPLLIPVQRGNLNAAGDIGARNGHDLLQRALNPVVDILHQARAQLHRQRIAGGFHRGARPQARGFLVNLDGSRIAGHGEDFADEPLLTYANHVSHVGVGKTGGNHEWAGNLDNFSAAQSFQPSFRSRPAGGLVNVGTCMRPRFLKNVRAHCPFDGPLHIGHANAQRALLAGNQNDCGYQLILIAGKLSVHMLSQLLGEIDHRVVLLGQPVEGLLGAVHAFGGEHIQAERLKAKHAVPVAQNRNFIHSSHAAFPG